MFKNHLKVAFRNLLRHGGYSFINIAGLAIGIACCVLILLYVQDEMSFDRHNVNADRTYRVVLKGVVSGDELNVAASCAPIGPTLVEQYPEVVQFTRIRNFGFPVIRYGDKVFSEERFYAVDSTFFDVFSVNFIHGDARTALTQPHTVVLTRKMAEKYFGDENPVGKSINADNRRDWLVTGVVEDWPTATHFSFDFLAALTTYADSRSPIWISNNYYTYVVLSQQASHEELEAKLPDLVRQHVGPQIEQAANISFGQFLESGGQYGYFLQALPDIHLHSALDYELEPNGDSGYVALFSIVALIVLLIACINFMNLATARSAGRAKEVGIRKTIGSSRTLLIRQFLTETVVMGIFAAGVAALLVQLALPAFNAVAGKQLQISLFDNWLAIPGLLGTALLVGVIAGAYPAFFLTAFKPISVLTASGTRTSGGHAAIRTGLVVFQFAVSVALIIATLVVGSQLDYIQNKKLGFNKNQVLVIEKTDDLGEQVYPFMQELRKNINILAVSNSHTLPGRPFNSNAYRLASASGEETMMLWDMASDHDFASTYQIQSKAGRFFSRNFGTDSSGIVLNEAAVAALGLEKPIGERLIELGPTPDRSNVYTIIGVVSDFHFQSLHQVIRPMAIKLFTPTWFGKYVSVRLSTADLPGTLAYIENTWKKFAGAQAPEYSFFDQNFAKLYRAEQITGQILTAFAAVAIVIACLGLFGLASFTAEQKTREIGIRKVLGASAGSVVFLLSSRFARWVLVASFLAWPLAWFAMSAWLQNFAYRTEINPLNFLLAAGVALAIALATVSYQTVRAAFANPVDALRYE